MAENVEGPFLMKQSSPGYRRPVLVILVALGIVMNGCARRSAANHDPGWYEIARTPQIIAYLDTARLDRYGDGRARVWFRFQYMPPITLGSDTTTRYEAMETRQDLDCPNRRTRGLELRMQAAGGIAVGVPAPDTVWQSIDTHPLNSGVFLVACRTVTGHPISPHGGTA